MTVPRKNRDSPSQKPRHDSAHWTARRRQMTTEENQHTVKSHENRLTYAQGASVLGVSEIERERNPPSPFSLSLSSSKAAVSHFTPSVRTCCQVATAATSRSVQPGCLLLRVAAHSSDSTRPDGWMMIWVLWVTRCSEVWGRHPLPAGDSAPARPQGSLLLPSSLSLSLSASRRCGRSATDWRDAQLRPLANGRGRVCNPRESRSRTAGEF